MHVPLVQTILDLQDSSVWSIRDVVRTIEKASVTGSYMSVVLTLHVQSRSPSTLGFQDFTMMHETARHAIHSFETLSVSVETVEAMEQQVTNLSTTHKAGSSDCLDAPQQIQLQLDSQLRMLRSLFLRSQSNKERLQNEIALVRVDTLAILGASADIIAGVQFDRTARQSGHEGHGGSSEARQWGSEDDRSSDYGVLASDILVGLYSLLLSRSTLKESRLYSA